MGKLGEQYYLWKYNNMVNQVNKLINYKQEVDEYKEKIDSLLDPVNTLSSYLNGASNHIASGVIVNNKPYDENEINENKINLDKVYWDLDDISKKALNKSIELESDIRTYETLRDNAYSSYLSAQNSKK